MAKPLPSTLLPQSRNASAVADEDAGLAELRRLQQTFSTALFRPLVGGERLPARWIDGRPMQQVTDEFLKPNDRLTSLERLEIYSRSYWYRLIDSMYDDYPGVRAVVGERKFFKLIQAYLAQYPSESYTARDLGSRFEQFIRETPALVEPHGLLALETARFEWAQVIAFDSEGKPPLALDSALGADPSALTLGLQPYLTLLDLASPIDNFIIAVHQRERLQSGASNTSVEQTAHEKLPRVRKPKPGRVFLAVHRQDNSLYYKRLDHPAFAILEALRDGRSLAEACELGGEVAPAEMDLGAEIERWFHDWAAMGWLCAR